MHPPVDRFNIVDSTVAMRYYDDLQRRLQNEWPNYPPMNLADDAIPKPLVALTSSKLLAGGLAFIAANRPQSDELAIWINAVLVAPEYRRQGLGSRLIEAAQRCARQAGLLRLYALTELPELYTKLNWSIFSNEGADFVMTWEA